METRINNTKQKIFNVMPEYLVFGKKYGLMYKCKTIEKCDIALVKKGLLETDKNGARAKKIKAIKTWLNDQLKDQSQRYEWRMKTSKNGNHIFWKSNEDLHAASDRYNMSDEYCDKSTKRDPRYYSNRYNRGCNDDYYEDLYVPLCDEFERDELDPDLAEAWDESNRNNY